jgi:hypothetical protein
MKIRISIIITCIITALAAGGSWYLLGPKRGYLVRVKTDRPELLSYLEISKGFRTVYRFAPVVPDSVGYPRPLKLEKIRRFGAYLVTSWGETGADYFGTHPIIITLEEPPKTIPIYQGELSRDERIRGYSWTRKDFLVTNYFDPAEGVKTILTQGVKVTPDGKLELEFYADEKPHAADHNYARIRVFSLK